MSEIKCKHLKWQEYKHCGLNGLSLSCSFGTNSRCLAVYCSECGLCFGCGKIHKIKKAKVREEDYWELLEEAWNEFDWEHSDFAMLWKTREGHLSNVLEMNKKSMYSMLWFDEQLEIMLELREEYKED